MIARSPRLRRMGNAIRLNLRVQWRSGFPQIYFGLAVATVVGARLALPAESYAIVVPVALLGEYATLGLYLVAAQRFLEQSERSVAALVVTPLESREHVAALVVASALVATAAGAALHAGILGLDLRTLLLLPPLFLTTLLAGLTGLIVSSYTAEFTRFILGAIPVTVLLELPFLSFFGATPRLSFAWVPSDAALYAFANLARSHPDWGMVLLYSAVLAGFDVLAFTWAERVFRLRVRENPEATT